MRALAEFIMRGRRQAALVVVGAAALPMLFWLSAAAGSLVLLRRGWSDAAGVLAWAVLPALVWWYFGDPRTLMVLLGAGVLASLLRRQASWRRVMLASVGLGVAYTLVLGATFGEAIAGMAAELQKLLPQAMPDAWEQMSPEDRGRLESLMVAVLTGLLGAFLQMLSLLSLMLGRYWQALLYNPGGFGEEFRALRFPPALAMLLLAGILLGPNLGAGLALLTPLCSVPLAFAGLALVHGLVAQGRLGRFWLIGLYVTLLLFVQLIYPLLAVLAIVDSVFDFRRRGARNRGQGPADGEG